MGRYNLISRTLWTLSILACGLAAPATTLADFAPVNYTKVPFGPRGCTYGSYAASGGALVGLINNNRVSYTPDGTYYLRDTTVDDPQIFPITAAIVAACLNTSTSNLTNFESNGADGTKTTDTYYGFSFSLSSSAGGLTAGDHEYQLTPLN
jgi:hypothetical protein